MIEALPLAISGYEFGLFLHITAVMVGFGATFAESIMFPVAMKVGARHLPYLHRLQLAINMWLATPALAIVIVTGLYLVEEGNWSFGDAWISATFLIVLVIGGLLGIYFIPTDRHLGPLAERDIAASGAGEVTLSEEYQRGARLEGIFGTITGILLIVAVFLMVTKPGA